MYQFDKQQKEKLENFRNSGTDPYPSGFGENPDLAELLTYLMELNIEELSQSSPVKIAARLRFKNEMGNIGFGRVEAQGQLFQICVQKNKVSSSDFSIWKKLDLGDWVLVSGSFMRTRTGELTLNADSIQLYAKCLESMPDKVVGLVDPEARQRMRYLDLIVNQESRANFLIRSGIVRFIRCYLEECGFIEVETPILQPIPGGASAKPFVTHHNALDMRMYMRVAPELYLKRLIVGGLERVFEIGKNFRNEGISTKHNPEFTMVEFYQAHATYLDLVKMLQNMITELVLDLYGKYKIPYGENVIDFNVWKIVRFDGSLEAVGVEHPWDEECLRQYLHKEGISFDSKLSLGSLQQLVFDTCVEPYLINPTFISHYPVELSPLARRNDDDPRVTDRFELFINGFEVSNGFSELNDPIDQAERFSEQAAKKNAGDDEAMYFDEDYIKALSYGMPPTAGCGIGIDRLVMLLTNTQNIRDIILFPTRKIKEL